MTPAQLRKRRAALGFSQEALARDVGVTVSTVYRWERGKQPIPEMLERALRDIERERSERQ